MGSLALFTSPIVRRDRTHGHHGDEPTWLRMIITTPLHPTRGWGGIQPTFRGHRGRGCPVDSCPGGRSPNGQADRGHPRLSVSRWVAHLPGSPPPSQDTDQCERRARASAAPRRTASGPSARPRADSRPVPRLAGRHRRAAWMPARFSRRAGNRRPVQHRRPPARIRPKRHDDWTVVPNLWGAIVARPGMLKTPALREVLKPLRNLAAKAHQRSESWGLWIPVSTVRKDATAQEEARIEGHSNDGWWCHHRKREVHRRERMPGAHHRDQGRGLDDGPAL